MPPFGAAIFLVEFKWGIVQINCGAGERRWRRLDDATP